MCCEAGKNTLEKQIKQPKYVLTTLKFDASLGENSLLVGVFHFAHLGDRICKIYKDLRGISAR